MAPATHRRPQRGGTGWPDERGAVRGEGGRGGARNGGGPWRGSRGRPASASTAGERGRRPAAANAGAPRRSATRARGWKGTFTNPPDRVPSVRRSDSPAYGEGVATVTGD